MENFVVENLVKAFFILVVTFVIAILFSKTYKKFINRSTRLLKNDPTNYRFVGYLISAIIYMVGIAFALHAIPILKAVTNSILAGAGIAAAALGFASQKALGNIVSGFFIIIFKPFRIGDILNIVSEGVFGEVEDITLRHTVINNFENQRIIIPNDMISSATIVNTDFHDEKVNKWIEFDISYGSDIDKARIIIISEVKKHPLSIDGRLEEEKQKGEPSVPVRVIELGSTYVRLRAWVWVASYPDAVRIRFDLFESVKKRFDREGIEIPFPYLNVISRKDEKSHE